MSEWYDVVRLCEPTTYELGQLINQLGIGTCSTVKFLTIERMLNHILISSRFGMHIHVQHLNQKYCSEWDTALKIFQYLE